MADDSAWILCYLEKDDKGIWKEREKFASFDLEDAKKIWAIYRYSEYYRNVRIKEVILSETDIPIEYL